MIRSVVLRLEIGGRRYRYRADKIPHWELEGEMDSGEAFRTLLRLSDINRELPHEVTPGYLVKWRTYGEAIVKLLGGKVLYAWEPKPAKRDAEPPDVEVIP